jgi:glycosyltransferase involved in cell wall biosynthesis
VRRPLSGDAAEAVTLVIGTTAGGTGEHVRMLAAGLARRGLAVTVAGPSQADHRFVFASLPGVAFVPVEFGGRPRAGDAAAVLRLRRTLAGARTAHAHGLRAGALAVLALTGTRGARRSRVVVTVHNAAPAGGTGALIYRLLERIVARGADLVLCVSPDLEHRMRAAGARRVDRAVVAAPDPPPPADGNARQQDGLAGGRPLILAAGRLAPQKGFAVLLAAAAAWQDLRPAPLLALAGDGPLAGDLRSRAAPLGDGVRFLGQRDDVPALLAAAHVFVLPSLWEGQPLVLQQALRAGAAIVATRAGGIPALAGDDAALLVEPGDADALAAAVRAVLGDPALAARLRNAARMRAAALPGEQDAIEAALAAYAMATRSRQPRQPVSRRRARRFLRDT